ncbi:MAG: FISUMP domain-containing protein, partial [Candidatus Woesearchaeota archaeon]
TSWGPTQIKVKVPTGAATGKVSVTVNGIKSNEVDFQIGSAAGNYEEVTIGTQTWMKKNLDVTHYRNGDEIPQVTDADEWENLTTGAWCYYNNDEANGQVYGKLYNWYAINDSRGLAPEGWHIPSTNEWKTLRDYLGNENDAGGPLKESGTEHWKSPNTGATNETGFTALPGGERAYTSYSDYRFQLLHDVCYFWSSTYNGSNVDRIVFTYNYAEFYMGINLSNTKKYGQSVRCIKD